VIFVSEFLTAERKWISNFCDNWENQHKTADKDIEFFKTTKTYREAVQKESSLSSSSSKTANVATLQRQTQNKKKKNNKDNKIDKRNVKKKNKKCLCLEMHLFEECDYICKATRSSEWKENKKISNKMRQRLKIIETYKVIKNVFDTSFLNQIIEKMIKKRQQDLDD
jgi:hypothetical protein